jgi:hypothetical protein
VLITASILALPRLHAQDLKLLVGYQSLYNNAFNGPSDLITPSNQDQRTFAFGLAYEFNSKHALQLSYTKILNHNTLGFANPNGEQYRLEVYTNTLVSNGVQQRALNEDGSDRLDRLSLDYQYTLFEKGFFSLRPSIGAEIIHTQEEFYYIDYELFFARSTNELPTVLGELDGQYHHRLTPFMRPGLSVHLAPEKSFLALSVGAYYRIPLLWGLNDIYLSNRSNNVEGIGFASWRTVYNNSGRALSLEFNAQLSLSRLRNAIK